MAEEKPNQPIDPVLQLRQYVESYRAAGVEWVQNAPLPVTQPGGSISLSLANLPPEARPASAPTLRISPSPATSRVDPTIQTGLFAASATPSALIGDEESRRHELTVLAQKVSECKRCTELWSVRSNTVFGVGPLNPDLCFLGEAPGYDEDKQGEPFVGAAGQLLNRIIAACGLRRDEVYILNILKCRPPGNRQPRPEEAHNCKEYLERQIDLIQPKFICALGASATTYLLGTTASISRLRGKSLEYRGIPVMCTFHPSYLLRTPEKKKDVWEDMKTLLARMGRTIPGKKEE